MKILLRLPNWLGDGVMATPMLELLKEAFPQASLSIIAPAVVGALFEKDTRIQAFFIDDTKNSKSRLLATYQLAKKIGKHDIAITLTNNFYAALLLLWTQSPIRIGYAKNLRSLCLTHALKPLKKVHQVLAYCNLLTPIYGQSLDQISHNVPNLKLHFPTHKHYSDKIRIGINPGGAYGSAKRWLKEYFVETILYLIQKDYEVILFGNHNDAKDAAAMIEAVKKFPLPQEVFDHITDLTGKTTISTLITELARLDLFITNDSGPMHIASALQIPLIAIFGPTNAQETAPWKHQGALILNKNLKCAPCKKRICPLGHHNCMKLITPDEVITQIDQLLTRSPVCKST
ncbi:lipopolysaccharide heptosyltransferase II [Helicobacter sp. 12S02634-8]|uniref:lipopolysaccharide heptosyltransferase II n=1 Tax=Helicobacter sp. 12S02634-8 TaxID=1476199 RepID=UPI000BA6FE16|nr:lipopolysaccharide heptosyltransferase II [Helicobacter sp. 12S02634-8]PAF48159.1 lipopolysaccharide heptosyltransferase II [Helicobacter sp. 12S02634-8]